MAGAKVRIKGLRELRKTFRSLDQDGKAEFKAIVSKHTEKVTETARANVPVDEGELRETIRNSYLAGGLVGRVDAGYGDLRRSAHTSKRRAGAPRKGKGKRGSGKTKGIYAMVVEFGDPRRNRRPQPYIFPAIESDRPTFEADTRAAVGRIIKKNSRTV